MKQGDTVDVTIAGQVVAQATVKEVGEGEVTLVVPATLVVMGTRTEIAPQPEAPAPAPTEPENEHQLLGVEQPTSNETVVVEPVPEVASPSPEPPIEETPVAEEAPATEETSSE